MPIKGSATYALGAPIPGVVVGQPVTGTNVAAGAYVTAVTPTSITLSGTAGASSTVGPTGFTTSSSNVVTGVSSVSSVIVGAPISGTNIPSNATVTAVDPTNLTITLSANASATSTAKATGVLASGSNVVTALSSTTGLVAGQLITATGIPANTYIGGVSGSSLTLVDINGQKVFATATSAITGSYTFSAIVVAGSNVVTPTGAFGGVVAGQPISGTGIPAGATIASLNSANVTISANATQSTTTSFTGITYIGSPIIANVSSLTGLVVGQPVTGPGVPANTTISALSATSANPLTVTLTNPLTQINTTAVTFSSPSPVTLTTKTSATTLTAISPVTLTIGIPVALTIGQNAVNIAGAATTTTSSTMGIITVDPLDVEPADPGTAAASAKGPQVIAGTSATPISQGFFNTAGSASATANTPAGFAFTRTFQQVIAVLLNTNSTNAIVATQNYQGGFYPVGISGNITSVT